MPSVPSRSSLVAATSFFNAGTFLAVLRTLSMPLILDAVKMAPIVAAAAPRAARI